MTAGVEPPDRHAPWVLAAVVALCAAGLALMAALGLYAFVWKTAVIPVILIAVLVTRRVRRFVDDWAVFLALVILFDFCRGFTFSLITRLDLPVYMAYAVEWERRLCGGHILPVLVQQWREQLFAQPVADRALTLVHGSHFIFFLIFGFAVWLLRAEEFRRYKTAVLIFVYTGLVIYLIVPTVPPWMASDLFGMIPPIDHVSRHIYNAEIPTLQDAFDINPIAAMPSLHAGLPTLCALIGVHHFGLRALPLVAYTALVWIAVVYLGEHYLVDVLAGAVLAAATYLAIYRLDLLPPAGPRRRLASPILLSALLITMAEGVGQATKTLHRPWGASPAFVERELKDAPGPYHYLRGRLAFDRSRFADARREFDRALENFVEPTQRRRAAEWSARSAFRIGDYAGAVNTLEQVRAGAGSSALILLAVAYARNDQGEDGARLLQELIERFPGDPEPLYWMTRLSFERQGLTRAEVLAVVQRMRELPDPQKTAPFQRLLLQTIETAGKS